MARSRQAVALEARPGAVLSARFWLKVDRRGANDCWLWTAGVDASGYGQFGVPLPGVTYTRGGEVNTYFAPVKSHRFAYRDKRGPIPDGLEVMHACDNPPCVNPAHLSLGTHADNMRDAAAKGRLGHRRAV